MTRQPRLLVACEFSGVVRDAFLAEGFDAVSCDLLPTEQPGPHIVGDVLRVLSDGWDMMIAHPPCTRLCNSGVRWLHERNLWAELDEAAAFFRRLDAAPIRYRAIENPVMHRYAVERIGRRHDFTVQPWQLGVPERKRTAFWVTRLPPLVPIDGGGVAADAKSSTHLASPSVDRWKLRSRTFPGVAAEMARQWGPVVKSSV